MTKLTFSIDTADWVWLCEMLADVRKHQDEDFVLERDVKRAVSCLEALEAAI